MSFRFILTLMISLLCLASSTKVSATNNNVLTIYADPFCPYCINALKQKESLEKYFELDIVWSPILGKRSDSKVQDIFRCRPEDSDYVIHQVVNQLPLECDGELGEDYQVNMSRFKKKTPSSVPQYYIGEQRISATKLYNEIARLDRVEPKSGQLLINWQRYSQLLLNDNYDSRNETVALISPVSNDSTNLSKDILTKFPRSNIFYIDYTKQSDLSRELLLLLDIDFNSNYQLYKNGKLSRFEYGS